jgi:hypothetical protein
MDFLAGSRVVVLGVVVALVCLSSACAPIFAREDQEVQEASCQSEPCQSLDELEQILGARPAQPGFVPDRFRLFTQEASGAESDLAVRPTTVSMEYRLLGSPNVPALTVVELVVRNVATVSLDFPASSCGTKTSKDGMTFFYGTGKGGAYSTGDLSQWRVCIGNGPGAIAAYAVYFADKNVIVEVKAFPESGISEEEMLKIAQSIRF